MNTEFPSRIPTVRNTQQNATTNSTVSSSTSNNSNNFQTQSINILKSALNVLNRVSDTVSKVFDKISNNKTNKEGGNKKSSDDVHSPNKIVLPSTKPKSSTEKTDPESLRFRKWVRKGIDNLHKAWVTGLDNLSNTVSMVTSSMEGAISGALGNGVLGRIIGKVLTAPIKWAVDKLLIGTILANAPMMALVGGIVLAVGLVVWYAEEIWDAIKWIGYAIDQGFDAIISIFGKSKYKEAREELAKELGVSEEKLRAYFGDTIRGRNEAYELYKKYQTDPSVINGLKEKLDAFTIPEVKWGDKWVGTTNNSVGATAQRNLLNNWYDNSKQPDVKNNKPDLSQGVKTTAIYNNQYNTYNYGESPFDLSSFDLPAVPTINNAISRNNTNIITSSLNDNAIKAGPYNSMSLINSDQSQTGIMLH